MIYASIVLFIISLILFLLKILTSSRNTLVDFKEFEELNAVNKGGRRPNIVRCRHHLKSFYKKLLKREEKNLPIFPFEKLLKENYYIFNSLLHKLRYINYYLYPYYKGELRILILARCAISKGYDETTLQIKEFIARVQKVIELDYKELKLFPKILAYAELEKCIYLCKKSRALSSEIKRVKHITLKGHDIPKMQTNSFWYYYNQCGEVPTIYERVAEDAISSFNNTLISYALIVEKANYIFEQSEALERELPLAFARADGILKKNDIYSREGIYTKEHYLNQINRLSDKLNLRESAIAELAVIMSDTYNLPLGKVLNVQCIKQYIKKGDIDFRKTKLDLVYSALVLISAVLISILPIFFVGFPIAYIFIPMLFVILLKPVEHFYQLLFSLKEKPPLYVMEFENVPENGKTTVVVSYLIEGVESLERGKLKIESVANNLVDENVFYCLLVDFVYSKMSEEDINSLRSNIQEFNNNSKRIQIALRKPCLVNNVKHSWERKRGAVLDLFKYIKEETDSFYEIKDEIKGSKFAILINDDSELLPGTIINAIKEIMHPMNEEYDILSFGEKINKYSIITNYSKRYSDDGSIDCYPCYHDFYSDVFDKGVFNGKGIVRIDGYLKLFDVFPDEKILHHGLIEGAFLHTGSLKMSIYEDAPQNFKNDVEKNFRRRKGNVLLLPYLSSKVKNRKGERISNNIGIIYKLQILINALDCIRELFILLSLFLGIISGYYSIVYISLLFIFLPCIYKTFKALISLGKIRFYYVLRDIGKSMAHVLEDFFFLPYFAFEGLRVYMKTTLQSLFRSKRVLYWTPSYALQGKGRFSVYSKLFLPSKMAMSVLSLISFNPYFIAYAGVYVLYAFIVYKGKYIEDRYDNRENEIIKEIATKTFKYFERVLVNDLPRSLYQYFPKVDECRIGSIKGFAFYLLSILCGIRMGLCDKQDGEKELGKALNRLQALARFNGHFYKSYDIETLEPLEEVISTTDSSILCCALFCIKGYARACGNKETEKLVDSLNNADFLFLFDKEKGLLWESFNINTGYFKGHLSVLESEGKLAYLIAISRGLTLSSWFKLSRDFISYNNNTFLSLNGSSLEYMLSSIFIRPPRYSMLEHSELNAFKLHLKDGNGYFGRSKGGIFDFDKDMYYLFSQNGVSKLAICDNISMNLYNPYSAFLFLPFSDGEVGSAVKNYISKGLFCKSGLYEGLHCDKVVEMQDTYHQGIIMATITNKLYSGYLNQLFINNPEIFSVRLLLTEPYVRIRSDIAQMSINLSNTPTLQKVCSDMSVKQGSVLSSGEYALACTSLGFFKRMSRGYLISPYYPYPELCNQCKTIIRREGQSALNFYDDIKTTFDALSVNYFNEALCCEEEIKLLPSGLGEVRRIRFFSKGKAERIRVSHYLDVALCTENELYSHKALFDMLVESEIDGDIVTFKRVNNDICPNLSVKALGVKNVRLNTNKLNVTMKNKGFCEEKILKSEMQYISQGRTLYPCYSFSGELLLEGDYYDIFILLSVGENSKKCVDFDYDSLKDAFDLFDRAGRHNYETMYFSEEMANVIGKVLFGFYPQSELNKKVDNKIRIGITEKNEYENNELRSLSLSLLRLGYEVDFVFTGKSDSHNERDTLSQSEDYGIFADIKDKPEKMTRLEVIYPIKPEISMESINAGEGGFTEKGYRVVPHGESTYKPYTNIISSRYGGVITTENSQFSFAGNSREYKLTNRYNDEINDISSEYVYIFYKGKLYDVCNHLSSVYFVDNNKSFYYFSVGEIKGKIVIRVNEKGCVSKKVFLQSNVENIECKLVFAIRPCIGFKPSRCYYAKVFRRGKMKIVNLSNGLYMEFCCDNGIPFIGEEMLLGLLNSAKGEPNGSLYGFVINATVGIEEKEIEALYGKKVVKSSEYVKADYGNLTINTPDLRLNLFYNLCLYSQVKANFNSRASFYQCVGAYRFKDQLLDCLTILYSDPERVKEHILLCAGRQYEEGDVMSWWDMPMTGVRTMDNSDGLYLCFITQRYIDRTADKSILERRIPFLHSRALEKEEISRYERPTIKRESKDLRYHLKLAIERVLDFGFHDLLQTSDNILGKQGKVRVESVWLSQFAYLVITECLGMFDGNDKLSLIRSLDRLKEGINKSFKGDRFIACYDENNLSYGNKGDELCELYLLPQSLSILSGAVDEEICKISIITALKLVDEDCGIIRSFCPPFKCVGKVEPIGCGKNGGQDTFNAVLFICALFKAGFYDKGYELLNMINPIVRSQGINECAVYQGEPYLLSLEIFDGDYKGRCGWHGNSGAPSLYYVMIVEYLFGLNFIDCRVFFTPRFPSFINSAVLKLRVKGGEYVFTIKKGKEDAMYINDRAINDKYITLLENKGKINVEVIYRDTGEKYIV